MLLQEVAKLQVFNILFLDIDGVLNSVQGDVYHLKTNGERMPEFELCPIAISNLQYIFEQVESLRIVVSSTWRGWGLNRMKTILSSYGINSDYVIDITPFIEQDGQHAKRGFEIQAWLDKNSEMVDKFVIVDDDADMVHLLPYLVQTDSYEGLMWRKAEQIIEKLK
jgi:hypothetical protein